MRNVKDPVLYTDLLSAWRNLHPQGRSTKPVHQAHDTLCACESKQDPVDTKKIQSRIIAIGDGGRSDAFRSCTRSVAL